ESICDRLVLLLSAKKFDSVSAGRVTETRGRASLAGKGHCRAWCEEDVQPTRQDHRGQFRVTKLLEQSEDVPVDGLFPDSIAVPKVAANTNRLNARVQRAAIKSEHSPFAVANDADFRLL